MTDINELKSYPKVYDGKFAEIYDLSSELPNTAFAFWKGFFSISDKTFVKEMKETSAYVKKANLKIFISDHSSLKVVTEDVLEWLHKNWYKTSSQNGLLLELAIDANSIFGQLSLEKMLNDTKTGNIATENIQNFKDGKRAAKLFLEERGYL